MTRDKDLASASPPQQSAQIVSVVQGLRGFIAVASDGATWYMVDPYFEGGGNWERRPSIPLEMRVPL